MKKTCKNCDGRSSTLVQRKGADGIVTAYFVCTQRDSDKWMQFVMPEDTCLDWEPEREEEQ